MKYWSQFEFKLISFFWQFIFHRLSSWGNLIMNILHLYICHNWSILVCLFLKIFMKVLVFQVLGFLFYWKFYFLKVLKACFWNWDWIGEDLRELPKYLMKYAWTLSKILFCLICFEVFECRIWRTHLSQNLCLLLFGPPLFQELLLINPVYSQYFYHIMNFSSFHMVIVENKNFLGTKICQSNFLISSCSSRYCKSSRTIYNLCSTNQWLEYNFFQPKLFREIYTTWKQHDLKVLLARLL